jgi:putative tryptophan/tyrosine transport system substrate-binding protein
VNRFPGENPERFRTLARELVELKPNVIIAVTNLGALELKRITNTIPIVLVIGLNPVAAGLVESLARPGGNVTGTSLMLTDLSGKRLGLLNEAVPNLSRVALLVASSIPTKESQIKSYQVAAQSHGISLLPTEITTPDDIERVIARIAEDHADGLILAPGGPTFVQRARIGASILAHRLPAIGSIGEEVPYGLLMSYGADFPDFFRRGVTYTDKILKGAKPADLPVEQPTKFKLILNLKTAKALGLTVPQTLLISTDEVIE